MFNFFEQPYTLIGAAVLVLFAMLTFRSVLPEKRRWWQLLVPALVVAAAFGLDMAVRTDLEKINAVINTCIKAVEEEDCNAIEAAIAEDYRDSYHNTKRDLMRHCRRQLSQSLVKKNNKRACLVQLSPPNATATLFATIIFEKDSYVSVNYKAWLMIEVRLDFQEQADKTWLINRIEILELDRQPTNWSQIR
ncbi:MAG: hypothetical protein ACYS9C_09100 [Planctomycetota bacterium]|jgi:hypothetical protein